MLGNLNGNQLKIVELVKKFPEIDKITHYYVFLLGLWVYIF